MLGARASRILSQEDSLIQIQGSWLRGCNDLSSFKRHQLWKRLVYKIVVVLDLLSHQEKVKKFFGEAVHK
eukprot:7560354-Karenia_brevis.AAC.1